MTKEELQNYLIDEAEYAEEEVMEMSEFEVVDSYFSYNGVIGYTADFLEVVAAAYGVKLMCNMNPKEIFKMDFDRIRRKIEKYNKELADYV